MRRYDDPIDVRQGIVTGIEAPAQFVWRDRLWVVRAIVAHWVRTTAWWEAADQRTADGPGQGLGQGPGSRPGPGSEPGPGGSPTGSVGTVGDLLTEHEYWRVEAGRGAATSPGVFDLVFDWAVGSWRLVASID